MHDVVFAVRFRRIWPASLLGLLLPLAAVHAEDAPLCSGPVLTLTEAAQLLRIESTAVAALAESSEIPARRVGTLWRFNCASLLAWLNGDWELRTETAAGQPLATMQRQGRALSEGAMAAVAGSGIGATAQESDALRGRSPQPPGADDLDDAPAEGTIGEAPQELTAEDVLLRNERVLLGSGQVVLDFGQFFAETDLQPLAMTDDGSFLSTIEQESLLTSLQARIGLGSRSELLVGTSYFKQESNAFANGGKIGSARDSSFGDVFVGGRRVLLREQPGRPEIIGTLAAFLPTDDSARALSAGVAFVKSIDPAVLFANVSYTHTLIGDLNDALFLEPEDRLDVAIGYALALNDTLALSMSVTGSFSSATRLDDVLLRQRDQYALRFGLTSWLASGLYIEPSVSFNLGGPEDGFLFGITVPYTLGQRSLRER